MVDTFTLTIVFIALCTVTGAFISGRVKDRCLKDLSGYLVTLEERGGKKIWGRLRVEKSSLEFVYDQPYKDPTDGHMEASYIVYKNEYESIQSVIRYIDDLDPVSLKRREKTLKITSSPGWFRRFMRRTRNVFGTVKDSLMEIVNLFMGRIRTAAPVGKLLKGQDKYISKLQEQGVTAMGMSYEPILERYVGEKIVLTTIRGDKKEEYPGILKDYTSEFIEVLDVEYKDPGSGSPRRADLVVSRGVGIVRHAGA